MSWEPRLAKWERWIDDVEDDLLSLWFDEIRWRQLHEMARDNDEIPNASDFLDWFDGMYLQSMALGIRRQAEIRDDSISLARLAYEIGDDPDTLLRARWPPAIQVGQGPCASVSLEVGREEVVRAAQADMARIREVAVTVREFVNKTLAHLANPTARAHVGVGAGSIDEAMGALRGVLNRYGFVLKGRILLSGPLPEYEWMQAFTVPWTTDERIMEYFERDYAENE